MPDALATRLFGAPTWRGWHGTSLEGLRGVLTEGLRGRTTLSRDWLAPMPHLVYLGRAFASALTYAFDGLYAYDPAQARWVDQNPQRPIGAVLRAGSPLEACLPDEDWVGELMASVRDGTLYSNAGPRLWDGTALPWALQDRVLALHRALPPERTQAWTQEPTARRNDVATWARIGKATIRNQVKTEAGRARLQGLLPWAPSVAASEGSVHVDGAWLVRAERVNEMAPDGVNLDVVGEVVPLHTRIA